MNHPTIEWPSISYQSIEIDDVSDSISSPRLPQIGSSALDSTVERFTCADMLKLCDDIERSEIRRALLGKCSLSLIIGLYIGVIHVMAFIFITSIC